MLSRFEAFDITRPPTQEDKARYECLWTRSVFKPQQSTQSQLEQPVPEIIFQPATPRDSLSPV